ncbi:MAG: acyltransferase family protein [Anaerolineales bacterium]|nr:acyltransferase family protein [Anaerolineales bacterium]
MAHISYEGGGPVLVSTYYFVISRAAVPLFFMVSGFLLLKKEEPYSVFFRKRAVKVAVPFFIWSVIYLLWKREGFGIWFFSGTCCQLSYQDYPRAARESFCGFSMP